MIAEKATLAIKSLKTTSFIRNMGAGGTPARFIIIALSLHRTLLEVLSLEILTVAVR